MTAPSAPPKPLNVLLIGTIIDSPHSRGLFDLGGGKTQLLSVGQDIETPQGPAKILVVTPTTATVHFDDRDITLEIPDDAKKP